MYLIYTQTSQKLPQLHYNVSITELQNQGEENQVCERKMLKISSFSNAKTKKPQFSLILLLFHSSQQILSNDQNYLYMWE